MRNDDNELDLDELDAEIDELDDVDESDELDEQDEWYDVPRRNVTLATPEVLTPAQQLRPGISVPDDYEECGDCGYDHEYDPEEANRWHRENPGSYVEEGDVDEASKAKVTKPKFKGKEFPMGSYALNDGDDLDENDVYENEPCENDDCVGTINKDGFCTDCGKNAHRHVELPSKNHYDRHEVQEEGICFDSFMDRILIQESVTVDKQPDSPQRRHQTHYQEHPAGRTRYVIR